MDKATIIICRKDFIKKVVCGHARIWIIALVSVVFFLSDFADAFIKPKLNPLTWTKYWEWLTVIGSLPTYLWAIIVLVILLVGAIETGYQLYTTAKRDEGLALAKISDYETPKLALLWKPNDHPYRWWDTTRKPNPLYFGFGIKNICGVTVHDINVELQKVDPEPESSYAPCPLRLRHNILPGNVPIREFSLNSGDTRMVQLMIQAENLDFFWMLTAIDSIPDWKIPIRKYTFYIRVSYSNPVGLELKGTYELYRDGSLWNMKEVPS